MSQNEKILQKLMKKFGMWDKPTTIPKADLRSGLSILTSLGLVIDESCLEDLNDLLKVVADIAYLGQDFNESGKFTLWSLHIIKTFILCGVLIHVQYNFK